MSGKSVNCAGRVGRDAPCGVVGDEVVGAEAVVVVLQFQHALCAAGVGEVLHRDASAAGYAADHGAALPQAVYIAVRRPGGSLLVLHDNIRERRCIVQGVCLFDVRSRVAVVV